MKGIYSMDMLNSNPLVGNNLQNAVNQKMENYSPQQYDEPEVMESDDVNEERSEQNQPDQNIAAKQQEFKADREENLRKQREKYAADMKAKDDEINRLRQEAKKRSNLPDEDLVEGRHYNIIAEKLDKLEEQAARREQYDNQQREMQTLKTKYTDFDNVVNQKTLAKLKAMDPDAFNAIDNARDLLSGGAAAYRIIQSMGINEIDNNEDRITKNLSKPGTSRNPGALTHMESYANRMTDEEAKAKYAEVLRYSRGG